MFISATKNTTVDPQDRSEIMDGLEACVPPRAPQLKAMSTPNEPS